MQIPETAILAVKKGATFLDEKLGLGGWAHRIVVADLDLSSCTKCMLGQLYGREQDTGTYDNGYQRGMVVLDLGEGNCDCGCGAADGEFAHDVFELGNPPADPQGI